MRWVMTLSPWTGKAFRRRRGSMQQRPRRQENHPQRDRDAGVFQRAEQLRAAPLERAAAFATALVEREQAIDQASLFLARVAVGRGGDRAPGENGRAWGRGRVPRQ